MTTLLQTRIELSLQRQNAELLLSLNASAARQLRLQHTVEGVSTVAISYYLVSLLAYPTDWLLAVQPALNGILPVRCWSPLWSLVWPSIRRFCARASAVNKSSDRCFFSPALSRAAFFRLGRFAGGRL